MWQDLLVKHTLDVMHYEKNVCENMIKVIFGEKDTIDVHKDMEEVGIWLQLWLQQMPNGFDIKPIAAYVMTYEKKKVFL